jgi:hypothetical protein
MTNYIHLLGSGHMKYFLENFGCLYLYSQQGWEALMGKVQAILHLNTQRGEEEKEAVVVKVNPTFILLCCLFYAICCGRQEKQRHSLRNAKNKLLKLLIHYLVNLDTSN